MLSAVVWSVAILGFTRLLFGSFFWQELQNYLIKKLGAYDKEHHRLSAEISNGKKFSPGDNMNRLSPHLTTVLLTAEELEQRKQTIDKLNKDWYWWRVARYGVFCLTCRVAWAAILLYFVTSPITTFSSFLGTIIFYVGVAIILNKYRLFNIDGMTTDCPSCGK